jgi:hypothetical protein
MDYMGMIEKSTTSIDLLDEILNDPYFKDFDKIYLKSVVKNMDGDSFLPENFENFPRLQRDIFLRLEINRLINEEDRVEINNLLDFYQELSELSRDNGILVDPIKDKVAKLFIDYKKDLRNRSEITSTNQKRLTQGIFSLLESTIVRYQQQLLENRELKNSFDGAFLEKLKKLVEKLKDSIVARAIDELGLDKESKMAKSLIDNENKNGHQVVHFEVGKNLDTTIILRDVSGGVKLDRYLHIESPSIYRNRHDLSLGTALPPKEALGALVEKNKIKINFYQHGSSRSIDIEFSDVNGKDIQVSLSAGYALHAIEDGRTVNYDSVVVPQSLIDELDLTFKSEPRDERRENNTVRVHINTNIIPAGFEKIKQKLFELIKEKTGLEANLIEAILTKDSTSDAFEDLETAIV